MKSKHILHFALATSLTFTTVPIAATLVPTVSAAEVLSNYDALGMIINGQQNASVHRDASQNSPLIGTLLPNSTVTIIQKNRDWYKIYYANTTGYVPTQFIHEMPKPVVLNALGKVVNIEYLPVRKAPHYLAAALTTVPVNEIVTITGVTELWYEVLINNTLKGYVNRQYVTLGLTESNDTVTENESDTEADEPVEEETEIVNDELVEVDNEIVEDELVEEDSETVEDELVEEDNEIAQDEVVEEDSETLEDDWTEDNNEIMEDELLEEDADIVNDELMEEDADIVNDELMEEETEIVDDELMEEDEEFIDDELMEEDADIVDDELVEEDGETVENEFVEEDEDSADDGYEEEYDLWEYSSASEIPIALNKTWKITFNSAIDASDISESDVVLYNSNDEEVAIAINVVGATMHVTPQQNYDYDDYKLIIQNIKSSKQKTLAKPIMFLFSVTK